MGLEPIAMGAMLQWEAGGKVWRGQSEEAYKASLIQAGGEN